TIPNSSLVYRGAWNPATQYAKNDVIFRCEFPPCTAVAGDRFFTATTASLGVDPYNSGSDFWFPVTNSVWNANGEFSGRVNQPPIGNFLFYESAGRTVFTFDFLGSPLYLLEDLKPCTVTGTFQDGLGNPPGNAFARFRLRYLNGVTPRITGSAGIVEP